MISWRHAFLHIYPDSSIFWSFLYSQYSFHAYWIKISHCNILSTFLNSTTTCLIDHSQLKRVTKAQYFIQKFLQQRRPIKAPHACVTFWILFLFRKPSTMLVYPLIKTWILVFFLEERFDFDLLPTKTSKQQNQQQKQFTSVSVTFK